MKLISFFLFCVSLNAFSQDFDANREFMILKNQLKSMDSLCDNILRSQLCISKQRMKTVVNSTSRAKTKIKTRVRHFNAKKYVLVKYKMSDKLKVRVLYVEDEIQFLRAKTKLNEAQTNENSFQYLKKTKIARTFTNELIMHQKLRIDTGSDFSNFENVGKVELEIK